MRLLIVLTQKFKLQKKNCWKVFLELKFRISGENECYYFGIKTKYLHLHDKRLVCSLYSVNLNLIFFLSEDVRKIIKKSEFYQTIDYNCLYFTIHEAVVIAQELNQQVGVRLFKKKVRRIAQDIKISLALLRLKSPKS